MRGLALFLFLAVSLVGQIRMPSFEKVVLPNGVVGFVMPKKDLPLVSIRVSLRGGSELDPAEMAGLSSITNEMLLRGTKKRSKEQLSLELDQLGITVRTGVGRQASSLEMQFLKTNSSKALALLQEILTEPLFGDDDLAQLISQRMDAVKVAKDQPQMALREYFPAFFFGKQHPYGRSLNGDDLSLPKIKRSHVETFWKSVYKGKNLVVVMAGDLDSKLAEGQLRTLFGSVAAGEGVTLATPPARQTGDPRLLLVDLPGATQTYFAIGQPGIARSSADRTRIDLVNTLFGGRFTSMLNDALRVDSGLTYGANSTVQLDRLPGTISIATFTKTESTEAAIDLALAQLVKLRNQGIDADQLASAKAYVKGEYPTRYLETMDQLSVMLTDFELFGLNRGEVDDLISRIDSASLEQVNQIARQYYRSEGLVFVLVGDASKIRKLAGKYAKDVREVKISAPGF
jgi:zinc protease